MTRELKNEIQLLVETAKIAYISSVDENGYPNIKAMLNLQREDLYTHYFSTCLYSRRAAQFLKNPKASVYFCNEEEFQGLMLTGEIEVMTDRRHKEMMWRE